MIKICQMTCTLPSRHSAVVGGKYYSRLCDVHFAQMVKRQMPSSGSADYDRGRDVEDHQADIQQPMLGGKINPDWTRQWPDKARQMFGAAAVEAAERKN